MPERIDPKITVRRMQKKDCKQAGEFCQYTMKWMYKKYLKGAYPKEALSFDIKTKSSTSLAKRFKDPNAYGFIALSNGKICGILLGMVFGKSGLGKISWIAVDPKHQHEGIGIRLMIATEGYLKRRGCHKVYLNTLAPLVPAIRLYMKFGLLPEAYLRDHWWGSDFIVMSKRLTDYKNRR